MIALALAMLLSVGPSETSRCNLTLGDSELACDSLTVQRGPDEQAAFTAKSGRVAWRLLTRCPTKTVCEVAQVARDGSAVKAEGVCRLAFDGDEISALDCRSNSAFGQVEMRLWPSR